MQRNPSLFELKVNKANCDGLNKQDQQRIEQIGLDAWLDETAKPAPRRRRPSRRVKDAIWGGNQTTKGG